MVSAPVLSSPARASGDVAVYGFVSPGFASFGSPGAGGSMGFADPTFGIGYGYVTSQGGTGLVGDPRDVALSEALYASIDG